MGTEKLTPDQDLAEKMLAKLVAEGLIPENRQATVRSKLLAGTASEGDWRSWVYSAQIADESDEEGVADAEEAP